MSEPAAWYGKLPTLGDFASRRLGAGFIEPWDAWLAGGLGAWKAADDGWLQAYLAGPSWRFVLEPDVLAKRSPALAGVLMPSVDSVGRYFPLTLVQPLARLPADAAGLQALLSWLHQLDDVAVDALQDDWPVAQLEAELAQLGSAPVQMAAARPLSRLTTRIAARRARRPGRVDDSVHVNGNAHPNANADADAERPGLAPWAQPLAEAVRQPARRSWWWCPDADGAPCLFHTTGLPLHAAFASLLAGELSALRGSLHAAN